MDIFQFCRDYYLVSRDLITTLGLPLDADELFSEHNDRFIRIVDDNIIQVSQPDCIFNKWSDSVEREFNLLEEKDRNGFVNFVEYGLI